MDRIYSGNIFPWINCQTIISHEYPAVISHYITLEKRVFSLDFRRLSHYCMSPLCFPMTIIARVSTYYLGSFNQPLHYLSNSIRLPGFSHMVDLMDWFTGKNYRETLLLSSNWLGVPVKFPLNQSIESQPPVQVPCLQLWMIQSYPIYVIYVYIIIHIIYIYNIYIYIYIYTYIYICGLSKPIQWLAKSSAGQGTCCRHLWEAPEAAAAANGRRLRRRGSRRPAATWHLTNG